MTFVVRERPYYHNDFITSLQPVPCSVGFIIRPLNNSYLNKRRLWIGAIYINKTSSDNPVLESIKGLWWLYCKIVFRQLLWTRRLLVTWQNLSTFSGSSSHPWTRSSFSSQKIHLFLDQPIFCLSKHFFKMRRFCLTDPTLSLKLSV